jgi:VanZ family protein
MKKYKKIILLVVSWFAVLFLTGLIFGFSNQEADDSSQLSEKITIVVEDVVHKVSAKDNITFDTLHHYVRKSAHFCIYLALGFFLMNALYVSNIKKIKLALFLSVMYAFLDEWHQSFIPGRSAELRDVFIDSIGSFLGIMVYILILKIFLEKYLITEN